MLYVLDISGLNEAGNLSPQLVISVHALKQRVVDRVVGIAGHRCRVYQSELDDSAVLAGLLAIGSFEPVNPRHGRLERSFARHRPVLSVAAILSKYRRAAGAFVDQLHRSARCGHIAMGVM